MDNPSVGVGRGDKYPVGRIMMLSAFADGGPPEGSLDVPVVGHMGPDEKRLRFRAVLGIVFRRHLRRPCQRPWSCLNPTGEEALPSFFGNHPFSGGFLRKISSRAIMAIPTTEKDRNKPSSRFLHIYASVCTLYAAVCSPYALFCLRARS